ncbi:MAG: outer membrane lipid asymmetry maintenance protein MlaD [Gemmobacter sp.]|uniref:outer membrane lipid asymmetry maintenance protein MlaD n=1 Tax=Gemmobacter sp. TaxID=1898957 RepID=UPI00391D1D68
MNENATEVAVGGAVLAVAIGFLVYAAQATGLGAPAGSYELRAAFRSVEGVKLGTDVRMAGVKVGTVTGLSLNPDTFMAEARFTVRDGILLPDDSTVLISSEGLLGGNFVEITPGGSPFNLQPGAEIEDTQGAVSLTTLLMKFVGGAAGDALKAGE